MENNNKRTLILSIIGILVLVIAVVGVSFAMFTFTGTGTKENVIKTGSVSVNFDNNTANNKIQVDGQYPETDATGMADTNNQTTFTVQGDFGGNTTMSVNYEMGLSDISHGTTLTDQYVKVAIQKNSTYVKGSASGGVAISTFASDSGSLNLIQNYYVTNGTLQSGHLSDTFTVKAYVSDAYDLPVDAANTDTENSGNATIAQQDGTAVHKKTTSSETYSFKIKVVAQQA